MRKVRGFIDPISLGFLLSLMGTTTALVVRDTNQLTTATDTVENIVVQEVTSVEIEDDYNF